METIKQVPTDDEANPVGQPESVANVELGKIESMKSAAADALVAMRIAVTAEQVYHNEANRKRSNETTKNYNLAFPTALAAGIDQRDILRAAIGKMALQNAASTQELDRLNKETGGFPNNGTVSEELYKKRTELEEIINAS